MFSSVKFKKTLKKEKENGKAMLGFPVPILGDPVMRFPKSIGNNGKEAVFRDHNL